MRTWLSHLLYGPLAPPGAACHLFVQSSSQQEALKTHWLPRQCRRKPVDWSPYHILYGVRFRPKDPVAPNHLIISDHSVWFIMVCMLSDSHTNHHFHQIISSWFACLLVYTQRSASKSSVQVIKTLSDHPHEDLFQIFVSHFEILFLMRTVHPSSSKV